MFSALIGLGLLAQVTCTISYTSTGPQNMHAQGRTVQIEVRRTCIVETPTIVATPTTNNPPAPGRGGPRWEGDDGSQP